MFAVVVTVVHNEKKKLDQPKIFVLIFVFASIFLQYEREPKPAPEAEKSFNVFVIAKKKEPTGTAYIDWTSQASE